GAKAEDVVKRLAASLAKAALQATLMGTGPLAGLFGTSGTNGATGGLFGAFGSIFGKATGGSVNAGQPYMVGERGRERFVPTVPGKIIPNNKLGGGAVSYTDSRQINITPANGVTPEQMTAALAAYDRQARRNIIATMQTTGARF
ncbi:hypothetical protein, partial [Nocardioides sp. NPDC004968]|uniref:hypothetical protein n=1 Tax=Nocardioides sp. NPDC004968 TaxID=3155894 RepID=UPI0033BAFDAC